MVVVLRRRLQLSGKALVFVTTSVVDRRPIFNDFKLADACISQLKEASDYFHASIMGYVLMPSHFHGLIGFPQIEHLSFFMQRFKANSAMAVKNILAKTDCSMRKSTFSLWQRRFDDLIIISNEQFRIKLEYIHNNPVKAGLISKPTHWKYSSANDWLNDSSESLKIDPDFWWNE
ncbi:conserved hypothetical protein [Candidatus Zixiibacteriota bacterium]|nr:conserved hypothetical protein [candidate division Zixibacteria bacterium]